jgi:hypothetical protein
LCAGLKKLQEKMMQSRPSAAGQLHSTENDLELVIGNAVDPPDQLLLQGSLVQLLMA